MYRMSEYESIHVLCWYTPCTDNGKIALHYIKRSCCATHIVVAAGRMGRPPLGRTRARERVREERSIVYTHPIV